MQVIQSKFSLSGDENIFLLVEGGHLPREGFITCFRKERRDGQVRATLLPCHFLRLLQLKMPISRWGGQKTVVHVHGGILRSRKKEGTPTMCNSMDGTGKHLAKWNQPGGKRQTPYDLPYKWNLINKTNKQAKYNQRHWNKEQTDSNQKGRGEG